MRFELPVIWKSGGDTHAGRVELAGGRILLTSKTETVSFGADSVAAYGIERAPAQRLRGLPVLAVHLADGEEIRVASMGGAGSLQQLAARVGAGQLGSTGT